MSQAGGTARVKYLPNIRAQLPVNLHSPNRWSRLPFAWPVGAGDAPSIQCLPRGTRDSPARLARVRRPCRLHRPVPVREGKRPCRSRRGEPIGLQPTDVMNPSCIFTLRGIPTSRPPNAPRQGFYWGARAVHRALALHFSVDHRPELPAAPRETWMARMAKTRWACLRHAASDLGLAMRHRGARGRHRVMGSARRIAWLAAVVPRRSAPPALRSSCGV